MAYNFLTILFISDCLTENGERINILLSFGLIDHTAWWGDLWTACDEVDPLLPAVPKRTRRRAGRRMVE
jgi:hypothetical protein